MWRVSSSYLEKVGLEAANRWSRGSGIRDQRRRRNNVDDGRSYVHFGEDPSDMVLKLSRETLSGSELTCSAPETCLATQRIYLEEGILTPKCA